ncbi:hypothetical protein ACVWWN_002291 [Mycobacterium sp. URHB0021]
MWSMTVAALKTMFDEMVAHKNADFIDRFHDPGFGMFSNGIRQDYASFAAEHRKIYATDIAYAFDKDEQAWVSDVDSEGTGKVAERLWITTSRPGEEPTRIEVVLIAAHRRGRIETVWELTYPNWADLAAFDDYETD